MRQPLSRSQFAGVACILGLTALLSNAGAASKPSETPSGLPEAAKELAEQARAWRGDALLMRIEVGRKGDKESTAEISTSFYFVSPPERLILRLPGRQEFAAQELSPGQFGGRGSFVPVPDFSVDLPQAIGVAKKAGMTGSIEEAELSVRTPPGRLPVLVWRIQSDQGQDFAFYVDALTGASLNSRQILDPPPGPDATLQASEDALRAALRRSALASPANATLWLEFVVKPLLEAKDVLECNARGGGWTIVRICMP